MIESRLEGQEWQSRSRQLQQYLGCRSRSREVASYVVQWKDHCGGLRFRCRLEAFQTDSLRDLRCSGAVDHCGDAMTIDPHDLGSFNDHLPKGRTPFAKNIAGLAQKGFRQLS